MFSAAALTLVARAWRAAQSPSRVLRSMMGISSAVDVRGGATLTLRYCGPVGVSGSRMVYDNVGAADLSDAMSKRGSSKSSKIIITMATSAKSVSRTAKISASHQFSSVPELSRSVDLHHPLVGGHGQRQQCVCCVYGTFSRARHVGGVGTHGT